MTNQFALVLISYALVRRTYLVRNYWSPVHPETGRRIEDWRDRRAIRVAWTIAVLNTWLAAWVAWQTI